MEIVVHVLLSLLVLLPDLIACFFGVPFKQTGKIEIRTAELTTQVKLPTL